MNLSNEYWLLVNEFGHTVKKVNVHGAFTTINDETLAVIEFSKYQKAMKEVAALKAEIEFLESSLSEVTQKKSSDAFGYLEFSI